MGKDTQTSHYVPEDYHEFSQRLREESKELMLMFNRSQFSDCTTPKIGIEVEAWTVDEFGLPASVAPKLIDGVSDPMVVPEISKFNFELNSNPLDLKAGCLKTLHSSLSRTWVKCRDWARAKQSEIVSIGSLPTLRDESLSMENMSSNKRYHALNREVMRLRNERPIHIDIKGDEHLDLRHSDLMLESSCTSMQIHLQLGPHNACRSYNAALALSAPMVAMCANTPFAFGKKLWKESRIPLFEQAVALPSFEDVHAEVIGRVGFGSGYCRDSLFEVFLENLNQYPVLLPELFDTPSEKLEHLRFHNGTIWRWNRALLGVEPGGESHLRLEHRSPASGPSLRDMVANLAFFVGACIELAKQDTPIEADMDFAQARENFYTASRGSVLAEIKWRGRSVEVRRLILDELLSLAQTGLRSYGIDQNEIDEFMLLPLRERVSANRSGAAWQESFHNRFPGEWAQMTQAYVENQESGKYVSQWEFY